MGDLVDHCAAHDSAICCEGDLAGLLRVRDAEADDDGHGGVAADEGDAVGKVAGDAALHAGDAFAGDVVDEAGAAPDDLGDAVFRRGGGDEPDGAEAGAAHELFVFVRFFGRQVEDEQAIHARAGGVGDEFLHAAAVEEVIIDVEDDGDFRVATDVSDSGKKPRRGGAAFQAALGGELVDEAISERVTERDAESRMSTPARSKARASWRVASR